MLRTPSRQTEEPTRAPVDVGVLSCDELSRLANMLHQQQKTPTSCLISSSMLQDDLHKLGQFFAPTKRSFVQNKDRRLLDRTAALNMDIGQVLVPAAQNAST